MPVSAPFRGLQATSLLVVLTYTCFFSARQRGRRDAKADTYLNAAERSAFEHGVSAEEGATAKRLSQVLGKEILFIDADADFHGCTIDGVIYLGAKSERSVLTTVAHEYTHLLESKGLYKKLRDFVFDTLAGEGATEEDLRAAKRAEHLLYAGLDDGKVDREIVAEFVETRLLTDEQAMREVVRREGKSFARRLLDTLRGLIEKIKAALHIGDADAEQLKMLERGRDILAEVIRSEEAATDAVAVTFSMVGKNKNGIEVYETSDAVKKLSYNERKALFLEVMKNQYRGRTARFVRNGHTYYALFSDGDMRKNIYGDKRSDTRGWKAKITAGADGDIFNLVENAAYNGSMAESGKNNSAHRSVHHWDYFIKTVQIDGRLYDLTANVRKTDSGEFVYFLQFNENKKTEAAPLLRATNGSFNRMLTASDDTSLSQDSPDVNSHSMQNSKNDADIDGFSVGGIKAKTADVGRLADAERMEQGGADSETVRRETGWYRGYDGKWRFEIDDSKMRFINHREESRRTWKLDELIRHDALFAAYPELRDYTVLNFGISDDVEAAFYPGLNRITLDPRLSRAEKRTALIHEIQHAIQLIEGFTAGATTDYWRGSLKTAEEKQLELRLRDFAAPDIFFEADMRKLLEGTPTAERDAAQMALEKRYGKAPVREYVDLYNRLRDLRAKREQNAERAYRDTAGEIEAADVANRLDLSEKQRAETRPDIDREEVRFSNEHPMFTMEARQTDSEGIMKLDDANIDKTKEKMTWLEANDLLEKQQGLSYRFYASDDPMSRAGYAMFADDHEQNGDAYGGDKPRAFSVREDDLVPVWELSEKIAEARHETDEYTPWILEDYAELSDEDFADMFNPSDIVDSAYAWDNEELTEWFYNHVAEPNKIGGVKTSDGAIVFDKDLIRRNIPAEIVYTQASSNEEFLAKYGDDTEADPDIRFSVGGEQTDTDKRYEGKTLYADSEVYSYDFLTALPDISVVRAANLSELEEDGKVSRVKVTSQGKANAGAQSEQDAYIKNRYTGRMLTITNSSIRHGLHGNENSLKTNSRLSAVIGDIVKNAVPINGLVNKDANAIGTYAMAAPARGDDGRLFVAIVTIEVNSGKVTNVELKDLVHAISGRVMSNKENDPSDTKSQAWQEILRTLTNRSEISISDFLQIVNRTHQSILSADVLQHLGEARNLNGHFASEVLFSVGGEQTDAGAEVSDADKRFAPVESAIKLLQGGADLWRTLRETGASPREIALRMATSGESDTAIRELTGLYRDALGVWTYDKAWLDAHVPDITDTRELRAGYKLGTVDEQLLGLAPEEVKASRRRLLDSAKLPADADAVRVRQTAANLHRGLRPTAAEFAEDRKTAAAKEAARLITAEKVPSADAAIRTGALLADIADVLEKKKVRAETVTRLTAQVRGENGAWETDNAAMTKIIRAGSKQLDVQDFTDFLFENAKELTESSYNSQYGHKETYALDKLGVQIQNPIVDIAKYGTKPSELIANEREQEELKRYIENEYASAAHPSPAERADARDVKREFLPDMKTVGEVARFYLDRTKWRMLYCVCI